MKNPQQKVNEYINKATSKFSRMPLEKQCATYLKSINAPMMQFAVNLKAQLIHGMISDYKEDSAANPISVKDWLAQYQSEKVKPLFDKILVKSKVTLADLENALMPYEVK